MIDTSFDLFYNWNKGAWPFILISLDFIIVSWIYLYAGLLISSLINDGAPSLDRSKGKTRILVEVTVELTFTLTFYILAYYFLSKLPTIIPNIEPQNKRQRVMFRDFLLVFSILSTQLKLLDKIKYIFNDNYDERDQLDDQIRENFNNCPNGFTCAP